VLDPDGVADVVKNYLMGYTSHNGTANLTAQPTPVRVVCKNTLNAAIKGCVSAYKIRHTKGAGARLEDEVDEARAVLGLTHLDAFEEEAKHLYATTVTDKQLDDVIAGLYPRPEVDKSGSFTKWDTRRDAIFAAWNREDGAGIKGTGWGAWNALTDANQWARAGRGDNAEENITVAGMGLDQATNAFRTASKDAVLALAS
jgi:phage/plasmid-like protein (TIGR03299 family)